MATLFWITNLTGGRKRQRIKNATVYSCRRGKNKRSLQKNFRPLTVAVSYRRGDESGDFVTDICRAKKNLSTTAFEQHPRFLQWCDLKYLKLEFSPAVLCAGLRGSLAQQYFSQWRERCPYPTILKIRDGLSSILPSAVDADYLIKNPLDRLRLPLDKRPRQPKPTITPEQFHALLRAAFPSLTHPCSMLPYGLVYASNR